MSRTSEDTHVYSSEYAVINDSTSVNTAEKGFFDKLDTIGSAELNIVDEPEGAWFSFRTFFSYCGSSWIIAIACLDPGNLIADATAGSYARYQLLSVLILATICGFFVQRLSLTLGAVTGKNLAQIANEKFSRPVSLILWVSVQLAIIGNDVQQIIASAVAFNILFNFPLWAGALLTFVDTFTVVLLQGGRKLEAFFACIVGVMAICFSIDFFSIIGPSDAAEITEYIFYPRIQSYAWLQLVGLVGSVIMPHNLYIHSAAIAEKRIDRSPRSVRVAIKYFSIDAAVAFTVSTFINASIICVFAAGFFSDECAPHNMAWIITPTNPDGACGEISLVNAGAALESLLGSMSSKVWAIGLLAAGQAATMTGSFAGQYVMEGFLQLRMPAWKRMLVTRSTAVVPALLVAVFTQHHEGLSDVIDQWLNCLQSLALPFALLPLLVVCADTTLMGTFAPSRITQTLLWLVAGTVIVCNFYLVASELHEMDEDILTTPLTLSAVILVGVGYLAIVCVIIKAQIAMAWRFVTGPCRRSEKEEPLLAGNTASEGYSS